MARRQWKKKVVWMLKVMLLSEHLYQSYISALVIKEELAATMPPEFAAVDIAWSPFIHMLLSLLPPQRWHRCSVDLGLRCGGEFDGDPNLFWVLSINPHCLRCVLAVPASPVFRVQTHDSNNVTLAGSSSAPSTWMAPIHAAPAAHMRPTCASRTPPRLNGCVVLADCLGRLSLIKWSPCETICLHSTSWACFLLGIATSSHSTGGSCGVCFETGFFLFGFFCLVFFWVVGKGVKVSLWLLLCTTYL